MRRSAWVGLLALSGFFAACDGDTGTITLDASATDAAIVDAARGDVPVIMDAGPIVPVADRAAGEHRALALGCDPTDATRCLLPWPSASFMQDDATQATHLRLDVPMQGLVASDTTAGLDRADGFSRATPVMVGLAANIDPATLGDGATGALRLIVAEGPHRGTVVPLRPRIILPQDARDPESAIIADPRALLAPATEYAVVLLDSLHTTDTTALAANDETRAALGLQAPRNQAQERLRAWHAPTRALLRDASIDASHVLRVWGFVTRSAEQPRRALRAMRDAAVAALADGTATVHIDSATVPTSGSGALEVRGHITGLPRWVNATHVIDRTAAGPTAIAGMHYDAPFRVLLPRTGTGDYPPILYGHGLGGDVDDTAFDELFAGAGNAKVNMRFDGLTSADLATTFLGLSVMQLGTEQLVSVLMQALAGGLAIMHSVRGQTPDAHVLPAASSLHEVLAAAMVGGTNNPVAGRHPNPSVFTWAGGSLGGTCGVTMVNADPAFIAGVVNVPGAAWSHFLIQSIVADLVRQPFKTLLGSAIDLELQVAIAQTIWDEVDGAAWADAQPTPAPLLLQESMGDPVLPNVGSEFAAAALGAVQVGAVLAPIAGVTTVTEAVARTAITQYRVPSTETQPYHIHGFAANGGPAGDAAMEQIRIFMQSAIAGHSRIAVPSGCAMNTPAGSCDFGAAH